jgi:hypothetical protein
MPAKNRPESNAASGETNVTDIELTADGRIFVFGTSLEVLDVLNQLRTSQDNELDVRLEQGQRPNVTTVDRLEEGPAS